MHKEKLDLLKKYLGDFKFSKSTKEAEFFCCFCTHHKKKLSINVDTDNWHCWVCGKAGRSLENLLLRAGATKAEAKKFSKNKDLPDHEVVSFDLQLPREYIPLMESNNRYSMFGKEVYEYLIKERDLTPDDIFRYKIGFCSGGEYGGRMVLPTFNEKGFINFFTTRLPASKGVYYGPITPKGYKNSIIFNELYVDWSKPVTIVEGFFDSIKAGDNAVPLMGSLLSKNSKLFHDIVVNQATVYLALDDDADLKMMQMAKNFLSYDVPVLYVDVRPFHDCGEMKKEDFQKKKDKAVEINERFFLNKKMEIMIR